MCVLLHYEKILKDRAKEMIDEVRDDRNASAKARRAAIEEGNVPAVLEEEVVA